MEQVTLVTRRERRATRRLRFVTAREARWAARVARLDYKVSGETGALRPPTKMRVRLRSDSRNGPAYLVKVRGLGTLSKPITHSEWRRLIATQPPDNTNK